MRVLMINANRERSPWPVPPIGACAVASTAEQAGHEVRFLDLCFTDSPRESIREAVFGFRPDVIGVSIRNIDNVDWQAPTFYLAGVKSDVTDPCKEAADCPIVVGGGAVGIMPAEVLQYLGVDYAVSGDGEMAFVELLKALEGRRPIAEVPGLAYWEGATVRVGTPARVEHLDSLPLARTHRWLDVGPYLAYNGSLGIQTKRGCALKCTYCTYNQIEGRCYRLKSPARIAAEIEEAVRDANVHAFEFVDSTFNIPLDHALNVCRMLADRKFPARFNTMGINPGAVTEDLFRLLQDANFTEISITPESASPAMLEALGKGFTLDDVAKAAALARKSQMPVLWYFMLGAPGENEQTIRETLRFADKYIPEQHLVQFVTGIRIFKGAPIEKIAEAEGQIPRDGSLLMPVWYRPPIDRQRLFDMLAEAVARHPNYILLQDNEFPKPLLRAASALHRVLRSKRPLWSYLRHLRRISGALGLPQHFRKPRTFAS